MIYSEERLDRKKHFIEVGDFNCGADDPLNIFLSDESFEYDENKYGSTYLLKDQDSNIILAFYTIKANGIQIYDSETSEYSVIPAVEISRIAVQYEFQQNGIGKRLFYDYILPKIEVIESMVAVKVIMVFVEPDNIKGIRFYESIGFEKADSIVQTSISESFNEECDLYVLSLENIEKE